MTITDPIFWFAMIRNASRTVVLGETAMIPRFLWPRICETFFILPDFGEEMAFPNLQIIFFNPNINFGPESGVPGPSK